MNTEFNIWYRNKYPNTQNLNDYFFAKEAYEAGQQAAKTKWIPVTEKLPEIDEYVLWKFENGHIIYDCIDKDDNVHLFLAGFEVTGKIISWMKLPEA